MKFRSCVISAVNGRLRRAGGTRRPGPGEITIGLPRITSASARPVPGSSLRRRLRVARIWAASSVISGLGRSGNWCRLDDAATMGSAGAWAGNQAVPASELCEEAAPALGWDEMLRKRLTALAAS